MLHSDSIIPTSQGAGPPLWGSNAVVLDVQRTVIACGVDAAEILAEDGQVVLGRPLDELILSGRTALAPLSGVLSGASGAGVVFIRGAQVSRADRTVHVDLSARAAGAWRDEVARVFGVPAAACEAVVGVAECTARVAAEQEVARLRASLSVSERARARLDTLREEFASDQGEPEMVGQSEVLRRVKDQVARVAPTGTTVLIHGETGSGKELVARSVHAASRRSGQAFVPVNCAAMPESLIESELFGHERGAFTGADRRRLGKFELADGGTLFLDEIAELPLQSQAKLLRVLQDGCFERVGGAETVKVDVRLVAATHRDLARQVERGRFREDLFYRVSVFRVVVPPLRDRKEDLRELVEHLHARVAQRMGRSVAPVSERSMRRVMAYAWPGNVRELANAVERATLLSDGSELEIELPDAPLTDPSSGGAPVVGAGATRDILLDLTLEQLQRLQITHALETSGYRVFGADGAAEKLDIHPCTLLSRMDKFGIPRPREVKRGRRA